MKRPLLAASCAIALLTFADPVLADEAGMKKYRDYLPAQIVVLPEKTRNSEVPMAYLQAARGADTEVARYAFASMLNSLMYQGLGNYDAAVQAFQKDLGDQPTGKLTVWQIYQLQQRSEFQGVEPPFIPGFFTDIKGGATPKSKALWNFSTRSWHSHLTKSGSLLST